MYENSADAQKKQPPVDAVIHAAVSEDELEASVYIDSPLNGGNAPSFKDLTSALSNMRITYGVNQEKLHELSANPTYGTRIVVAKGIPSVDGEDGSYQFHFQSNKELKPKERKDGSIDYHDLGIVENVKAGQLLCSIVLPTDGAPGQSVNGRVIYQRKGRAVPFLSGKNTELSEDGTAIYAKINGHVEFDGSFIHVHDTFIVQNNVDSSTGDIKVLGNVIVKGIVFPGFAVEAGGNADIHGTVESASVKAGGNIHVHSGITGSKVHCNGDLSSRFIENCSVTVHGSIQTEYIMSSDIKCGQSINLVGMVGKFVGGSCIAGQDIYARNIGSPSCIPTSIELGTDPTILERQQELIKHLPQWKKQIESLKMLVTLFQQLEAANRLSPERKETYDNTLYTYETTCELIETGEKELTEIEKALQKKGFGKVVCKETIYPGTLLKIGYVKMPVTNALNNVTLTIQDDAIHQGPAI